MEPIKRDTTETLFREVLNLVKAGGHYDKAEAILDYVLPNENESSSSSIELSDYRFDFLAQVNFGSSEGIYVDCYLCGKFTEEPQYVMNGDGNFVVETTRNIGTFKTLHEDLEAMKIMGELCGALTFFASQYINANIHRYTPTEERRKMDGVQNKRLEGDSN